MSYQIKSTPFFRRMLSTSKKNGQLQKLKEEYERMKDFNDRTIEMKMREVRLKRLFKDIEDIKELAYHLPKRSKISNRNKTAEDIRVETFLKARELGKEFSKLNGLLAPSTSKSSSKDHFSQFSSSHLSQRDRKLLVQKAKNYGNDSSRANLVKISTHPRKILSRKREIANAKEPDKHEILMQRLRYGNSRSHLNMSKIPKRDGKHNVATDETTLNSNNTDALQRQPSTKSFKIPSPPDFCYLERKSSNNLQSSETFVQEKVSNTHSLASSTIPTVNNYEAHLRAKKYWRKVALTVLNRFDKAIRYATKVDDEFSDDYIDNEFRLRTISNNTDLTSSTTIAEKKKRGTIDIGANEPEPNEENEVLLRVEPLYTPPTPFSDYDTPMYTAPTSLPVNTTATSENQSNLLETINEIKEKVGLYEPPRPSSDKVQQLAKIFEPFVRDAAQKEAFDGVQKLKSIFESQSE